MSGFMVMLPDMSTAYKGFVLIFSVCATCREVPGTCQEKPSSSAVALQREMGMPGDPVWLLPAPGISIQRCQQALNTQGWPLAHPLHQSSLFSEEADVYRALDQHQPTPEKLPHSIWFSHGGIS